MLIGVQLLNNFYKNVLAKLLQVCSPSLSAVLSLPLPLPPLRHLRPFLRRPLTPKRRRGSPQRRVPSPTSPAPLFPTSTLRYPETVATAAVAAAITVVVAIIATVVLPAMTTITEHADPLQNDQAAFERRGCSSPEAVLQGPISTPSVHTFC